MKCSHYCPPTTVTFQLLLVLSANFLSPYCCEAFQHQISSATRHSSSLTLPIPTSDTCNGRKSRNWLTSAEVDSFGVFGRLRPSRLHYISPGQDDLLTAGQESVWFQNAIQTSIDATSEEALSDLIGDWLLDDHNDDEVADDGSDQDQQLLIFLFLSHHWNLENVTSNAMDLLEEKLGEAKKDNIHLITVIGGGVIGQNDEYEADAVHPIYGNKATKKHMSILGGYCKKSGETSDLLQVFSLSNDDATGKTTNLETNPKIRPDSSLFVFSDPYCRQVQNLFGELHALNCQVAGGVSVPHKSALYDPTLAINRKTFPRGSLVGVQLPSNYQLQCVVSQGGCRPVGPTYRVTSVNGPAIHELNEVKALEQLDKLCGKNVTEDDVVLPERDQALIRQGGILAGVFLEASPSEGDGYDEATVYPSSKASDGEVVGNEDEGLQGEYMVREVTGFRPRSGSILVCGQPQVQQGDLFRFHVRSSQEALDDWKLLLEQAKMEQLFLNSDQVGVIDGFGGDQPSTTSRIVCGMQISSLARGKDFFDIPNVDLDHAKMLLESKKKGNQATPPIGGFFSNAEIGPVGIRMGAEGDSSQPYLHGFATVVAMLCEITPASKIDGEDNGQETISCSPSSWA